MTDASAPPPAPAPLPAETAPPAGEEPRLERLAVPEVEVVKRRGLSVIWLVPLVAAAAGCWLAYQSFANRGIPITVALQNAEGLEAGKTRVKYKAVDIGVVEDIRLAEDLDHAVVSATIDKEVERHLTVNTRFWVVRPRVGASGVSGLSTVLSGVYVEVDPAPGPPARFFVGLEQPPVTPSNAPGLKLVLHAARLGSLDTGSPIFHCDIPVGKIEGYRLLDDGAGIDIDAFIDSPYQDLVRSTSRFWNASGIDVSLSAAGVSLRTQSLATLLAGGVAFETPAESPGAPCTGGARFDLYEKHQDILDAAFTEKIAYVAFFKDSVRGLSPAAPVEFRGVRIGSVSDVSFEFDPGAEEVRIPVTFNLEPGRVARFGPEGSRPEEVVEGLVRKGLRAQLRYSNVLTGQRFIDLDFHPGAPPAEIQGGERLEFPTVPSTIQHFAESALDVLEKLRGLPLEELAEKARQAIEGVDQLVRKPEVASAFEQAARTLDEVRILAHSINDEVETLAAEVRDVARATTETLERARSLVDEAEGAVAADSPLMVELLRAIEELGEASRSIRRLADYLEGHPEALIQGKKVPGG
ncbi:MAG: MCE family protein [Planctomycetes bacterium]|nr:MCE family protein [Planctomycetota bacterium]